MYTKDVDKKRMKQLRIERNGILLILHLFSTNASAKIVLGRMSCNDYGVKCIKFSRTITRTHLREKEVVYTYVDRLVTTRGQIETNGNESRKNSDYKLSKWLMSI